jgi:hypothetical protein
LNNGTRHCGVLAVLGLALGSMAGCHCGGRDAAQIEPVTFPTSPVLNKMVGTWNVDGSVRSASGQRIACAGTATAKVERDFFLHLDMKVHDPSSGQDVEGSSLIGQDGGRLLTMASAYSSHPELRIYRGELDQSGTVITLNQIARASDESRRIVLRLVSNDEWTAEVWNFSRGQDSGSPSETLTFHRTH